MVSGGLTLSFLPSEQQQALEVLVRCALPSLDQDLLDARLALGRRLAEYRWIDRYFPPADNAQSLRLRRLVEHFSTLACGRLIVAR